MSAPARDTLTNPLGGWYPCWVSHPEPPHGAAPAPSTSDRFPSTTKPTMSKQIHDETNRRKQVKFRADAPLVNDFDDWVGDSTYSDRADALRSLMEKAMHATIDEGTPLVPPSEQPLRKAYLRLADLANHDGVIPHDVATSELGSYLGRQKRAVEHTVLQQLRERGYLRQTSNIYGDRSWTLRGMDNE